MAFTHKEIPRAHRYLIPRFDDGDDREARCNTRSVGTGRRPMDELESTESRVVFLAASETPGSICSRDTMNRVMGSIMGKGKSWGRGNLGENAEILRG